MAILSITRGTTLPNSSAKSDFHNLIDTATGTVTNIVNADCDAAMALQDTKLAQITTADKVAITALTKASNLTTVTGLSMDYIFISDTSDNGNSKKALASDFTFIPTASNALAGSIVQVVNVQSGAVASGSTVMPYDDSIPQNTEGDEYMTLAITPTSATNKLLIDVRVLGGLSANDIAVSGLFQDSTAGALAAGWSAYQVNGADRNVTINFTHFMTSGTTSATTFKVRAGAGTSGTFTFNGGSGSRKLGGVAASSITIREIKV